MSFSKKDEVKEDIDVIKKAYIQVVVLGTGYVGKTTFIHQFVCSQFLTEYDPTLEEYHTKQYKDKRIHIYDTAGPEEYNVVRDELIKSSDGIFLCFSIDDKSSFEEVQHFYKNKIEKLRNVQQTPLVILGTKSDLEYKLESDKRWDLEEAKLWAKSIKHPILITSSKKRENIDESFGLLIQEIEKIDLIRTKDNSKKENCKLM